MSNLLLISAPGAGKGVVSKYLKEKYNYMHISMGNLLREKAKEDKKICAADDSTIRRWKK